MSRRQTRYHPLFDTDLQRAYDWYDAQRDGLATEFLSEVRRGINNIQSDPTRFARDRLGRTHYRLDRFPYLVIFEATTDSLNFYAIIHTARRTRYTQRRMED